MSERKINIMHNGIELATIKLSTGETYTPEKNKPPVNPCLTCKEKSLAKWGQCNDGFGVCVSYMDYEHMKAVYKTAIF